MVTYKRFVVQIEKKLTETAMRLEEELAEEHAAMMRVEEQGRLAQMKSNDEIHNLRESLERAQRESKEA